MNTTIYSDIYKALTEPFNDLKWKQGSYIGKDKKKCNVLSYIDARQLSNRLNKVLGLGGWQKSVKHNSNIFICSLSLKIDNEWITRDGVGVESKIESEKGGDSDAFKRAEVNFGIGEYIYSLPSYIMEIDGYKFRYNNQLFYKKELSNFCNNLLKTLPTEQEKEDQAIVDKLKEYHNSGLIEKQTLVELHDIKVKDMIKWRVEALKIIKELER